MKIIPVIDLKDGIVVSAQQGQRKNYQAIESKLSNSCSIDQIIDGFLSIFPFKQIYLADLNAITKTGDNDHLINQLIADKKHIEFWVDSGQLIQDLPKELANNYKPVIGSESQKLSSVDVNKINLTNSILSLDFFPNYGYKGPRQLLENSAIWPQNIIIMTLERVGKNNGPDIPTLKRFKSICPNKNFIAAGGIRNGEDLIELRKIGISHALIASALHSGDINAQTIKNLNPC